MHKDTLSRPPAGQQCSVSLGHRVINFTYKGGRVCAETKIMREISRLVVRIRNQLSGEAYTSLGDFMNLQMKLSFPLKMHQSSFCVGISFD